MLHWCQIFSPNETNSQRFPYRNLFCFHTGFIQSYQKHVRGCIQLRFMALQGSRYKNPFMGFFLLPLLTRGHAKITYQLYECMWAPYAPGWQSFSAGNELAGARAGHWQLLHPLSLHSPPSPSARREPPRQADSMDSTGNTGRFCCPARTLTCFMLLLKVH